MTEKPLFKHITEIEIRFADIDAFGHVNNAVYLTYFENARVKYFNEIVDWTYDWSKEGVILARAEINFIQPAHFNDKVFIETRCARMGNKSFDLHYRMIMRKGDSEILLADSVTVMVAFDYVGQQSIPVPDEWKSAIEAFEH